MTTNRSAGGGNGTVVSSCSRWEPGAKESPSEAGGRGAGPASWCCWFI